MQRFVALVILAVVGVMSTAGCRTTEPRQGEARLVLSENDAVAGSARDGSRLLAGALVRATRGEPELELSDGRRVALRPGSAVRVGDPLVLVAGDALVIGEKYTSVDAGAATLRSRGAARVSRTLASSVRVYRGDAVVRSAGRTLAVKARREASVPALGLVPAQASWATWDREDAWDVRHFGVVIELTEQLEAGARSFAAAALDASPADVATLLPEVPVDAWTAALHRYDRGEAFVGGAIAAASDATARVDDVLGLRGAGAAWGIVAVERAKGDPARAVQLVFDALGKWSSRPRTFVATTPSDSADAAELGASPSGGAASGPTTGRADRGSGSGGSGSGSDSGSGSGGATTTTLPDPAVPTVPTPPTLPSDPGPTGTTPTTVRDPLGQLIGGVLGGNHTP